MTSPQAIDTQQKAALVISAGILIVTVCYWIAQIIGVMEMLKLAYG